MIEMKHQKLSDAVTLHGFGDATFKTIRIAVNMFVPLTQETAAVYGMLPSLVSRASKEFPDYTSLGQKLQSLYGASLDSAVGKLGAYQVISLSVGGISSRYAFDGEDMVSELTDLLLSILSAPLTDEAGLFPKDGFLQEQRQILEIFDANFNDKMAYARKRGTEILFGDAPQGIDRHGTREEVQALDRAKVTKAWGELLRVSRFEVFVLGDCTPDEALFRSAFSTYGATQQLPVFTPKPGPVKRVEELLPLSQSKLFMGYTTDMRPEESMAFRLMSAALGGVPSAKLFVNVREKLGLCYYCNASFDRHNRVLMIESGVEHENLEKTQEAVSAQLEAFQQGQLTDEELLSAKLAVCNAFGSMRDSLYAMESWYLGQVLQDEMQTPEQAIEAVKQLTKEELIDAANRLTLDTVYQLTGTQTSQGGAL